MEPTQLFLMRHAEVDTRYHRTFGGSRIDMDLSPRGHEQAEALAQYAQRINWDMLYVSPMKRANQTLAPMLKLNSLTPRVIHDLREVDFGDWTGLTWDQVQDKYNVSAFEWLSMMEKAAIPQGECSVRLRNRVEPCLEKVLADHPGEKVGILCHGGIIRMLLAVMLGLRLPQMAHFDIEYASITQLNWSPRKVDVQFLNFTPWRDL